MHISTGWLLGSTLVQFLSTNYESFGGSKLKRRRAKSRRFFRGAVGSWDVRLVDGFAGMRIGDLAASGPAPELLPTSRSGIVQNVYFP